MEHLENFYLKFSCSFIICQKLSCIKPASHVAFLERTGVGGGGRRSKQTGLGGLHCWNNVDLLDSYIFLVSHSGPLMSPILSISMIETKKVYQVVLHFL